MSIDTKNTLPLLASIKHSLIYLILIPFVSMILVAWASYHRIIDFKNNQTAIASSIVNSTAQEITRVITEQKKLLNIFVDNERYYIKKLVQNPNNEVFEEIINRKIKYYFPNHFTFTVVDADGNLITEDYDGYIGEVCIRDIISYAKTGKQRIQVHPNPFVYHTDAIIKIDRNKDDGYFFASFATDNFSRILALSSPNDQSLMLVNTQAPELIEIVEEGARIVLNRDSYSLSNTEKQRILFSTPVVGSNWRLISLHDEDLFSNYAQGIIIIAIIIISLFVLSSLLMVITLCRSEKQRIESEEAKEYMFSLFSHELRSPLTSIYGTVQLLKFNAQLHGFDDGTTAMISDAVQNSEHMIMLINDLLDMQKLESGKMSFDFERYELNAFIVDVIGLNKRLSEMHHVEINFNSVAPITADIDRQRFTQVITNLLSNAIKYSPKNERIFVSLSSSESEATISIKDSGPGISEDVKENLFEKFVQSTSNLTQKVGGTGLGLSIVKSIVEEHGGEITVVSATGQGAEFIVKIPLNHSF